jgi:hypothetical protein
LFKISVFLFTLIITIMKTNLFISLFIIIFAVQLKSQNQQPFISPNTTQPYWRMGTNNNTVLNNTLGFAGANTNPLYIVTRELVRMKVNSTYIQPNQYPINGFTWPAVNTSGYVGIGENTANLWSNKGPFSLLHLNGPGTAAQEFGYRPWMQTGITFTSNDDLMYIGHRTVNSTLDLTEAVFVWSDNHVGGSGPDDMVFRFTSGSGQTISTDMCAVDDLDGRQIIRLTGFGLMGLGPTFTHDVVRPQSLLHMSLCSNQPVFSQYTNEAIGETATDGLKVGILDDGTSLIYNQETRHLLLSAAEVAPTATGLPTRERIRVTAVGVPGTPVPAGVNNNATRVSISHNPSTPVNEPRSLLHLGYNTSGLLGSVDGWRPWMDVGMFVAAGSDNIFIGLKSESTATTDRQDAVISWGDNPQAAPPFYNQGPDNLRFIFI